MKKPTIGYYDNGQKKFEIYHNDNVKLHREDGPAITRWYNNGQMQTKEYYINGKLHRKDGPGYIYWFENGQIQTEEYYINNKFHRENGPATIYYNENGQIKYEEYFINGEKLDKFQLRKLKLEKLNLL